MAHFFCKVGVLFGDCMKPGHLPPREVPTARKHRPSSLMGGTQGTPSWCQPSSPSSGGSGARRRRRGSAWGSCSRPPPPPQTHPGLPFSTKQPPFPERFPQAELKTESNGRQAQRGHFTLGWSSEHEPVGGGPFGSTTGPCRCECTEEDTRSSVMRPPLQSGHERHSCRQPGRQTQRR